MLFTSEFDGGLPVGTVIQASGMGPPEPLWLARDGRLLSRSVAENALLSPLFPVGKMTGTIRTLAAAPAQPGPVIHTGTHFVAPATTSVNGVQYSTDGVSWATATTLTMTAVALLATPTRLVSLSSGANAPQVSASLNPASAWSGTSNGGSSFAPVASFCRLAYIPTTTPGRVVSFNATDGVRTLDEGSTAWVSRTSSAKTGGAWTGQRMIGISAASNVASLTTDGVTWVDFLLPEAISTGQGNIASNGAGIVVITGCPSGIMFSDDHGGTFRFGQIPGIPASDLWRVQFSDGYFIIPTTAGLAFSADGKHWFVEPTMVQTNAVATGVCKKGSTIVEIVAATTAAYTLVESATEFYLPNFNLRTPANSGNPIAIDPSYIKAL